MAERRVSRQETPGGSWARKETGGSKNDIIMLLLPARVGASSILRPPLPLDAGRTPEGVAALSLEMGYPR